MARPDRPAALLAILAALAACSSSKHEEAPRPGCAAGTTVPAAWKINLSHGLGLVDHPFSSEPSTGMRGSFHLAGRSNGPAPDVSAAVVTLNGAPVPQRQGAFDFGQMAARPAGVEPGGAVQVVATIGSECTSVSFTCPSATIASPAEGGAVAPGSTVTITWQGQVSYPSPLYQPAVGIDTYSPSANERSGSLLMPVAAAIGAADTSAALAVPADAQGGYVIQLAVPGAVSFDTSTEDAGLCIVDRRVHLVAAP